MQLVDRGVLRPLVWTVVAAALACTSSNEDGAGDTGSTCTTSDTASPGSGDGCAPGSGTTGLGTSGSNASGSDGTGSGPSGSDPGGTDTAATHSGPTEATDSGPQTNGTGSYTTGDPGNVEYSAFAVPGGLDRIFVRKADLDADLCTSLTVVWPGDPGPPEFQDIDTPADWAVEQAAIHDGASDCAQMDPPAGPMEAASSASGAVEFGEPGTGSFPCTIHIDVALAFPPGQPWVPAGDNMSAADLPVAGC